MDASKYARNVRAESRSPVESRAAGSEMPDARAGLGRPEQTAGGLRGAKPPGLGVRGLPPGLHKSFAPWKRRGRRRGAPWKLALSLVRSAYCTEVCREPLAWQPRGGSASSAVDAYP